MKPHANPIDEAKRYIANAKKIIAENTTIEGKFYDDPKYVRMGGNTAWNGVLIALEAVFDVQSKKSKGARPDFKDYQGEITKKDKKLLNHVNNAYNILHKFMGYDGVLSVAIVKEGFADAKTIIDWCEVSYKPPVVAKKK